MKILISKPTGLGVTVMGGHIYAAGGHSGAAYLDRVERYDPFTDTWSLVKTMLNCRCNFAFAALWNQLASMFQPHTYMNVSGWTIYTVEPRLNGKVIIQICIVWWLHEIFIIQTTVATTTKTYTCTHTDTHTHTHILCKSCQSRTMIFDSLNEDACVRRTTSNCGHFVCKIVDIYNLCMTFQCWTEDQTLCTLFSPFFSTYLYTLCKSRQFATVCTYSRTSL